MKRLQKTAVLLTAVILAGAFSSEDIKVEATSSTWQQIQKELEYIAAGGALINMDQQNTKVKVPFSVKWGQIKQLLGSRMILL